MGYWPIVGLACVVVLAALILWKWPPDDPYGGDFFGMDFR